MARPKKEQTEDELKVIEGSIEVLNAKLSKMLGKEAFLLGPEVGNNKSTVSTGSIQLDTTVGRMLPVGIYELAGPAGVGKTTLSLQICANAQKKGWPTYYINQERALNDSIIGCIEGLDSKKLHVLNPAYGDHAFDAIIEIFRSVENAVVILDSVTACTATSKMSEEDMAKSGMAILARLVSTALPRILPAVFDSGGRLFLLNQARSSMDNKYDLKGPTPGGNPIEHYTNIRLWLKDNFSKDHKILDGEKLIGKHVDFEVVKDRFSGPGAKGRYTILFGKGSWREMELLNKAIELGVITKTGQGRYSVGEEMIAHGESKMLDWLKENPAKTKEFEASIYKMCGIEDGI